ncbi:hypothetical protein FOJ82_00320 [Tessaracoccus rhinocerotis]|uniref:Uncharacterized protein n=1 Tax=Tessaracoccus rhinocerotis TaxID=1689449 RepID=A0A553K3W0_9ACTN|nr:hypothetical protein [Tessaracoccus rhinocerotis]TRY19399.1 hypothetical protein FOJ82_00320 [Tessaracoccus rhinocerotis]
MTGSEQSPRWGDDGLFFAGIGAEDDDLTEPAEDQEAILADTRLRPDDEETGPAPGPLLGLGAGAGGAAVLGAHAGQTRAENERSRSGVSGAAPTAMPLTAVPGGDGLGVDGYGRITDDDPWGVGSTDEVPGAFLAGTTTSEAPRARSGGGTRGSYLSRNDPVGGAAIPGATLGGVGGIPSTQGAGAGVVTPGSQQGGIPLSVLQNLQNNRAGGAAFAPMTGVQASGSQGYMADPSLAVVQAFGAVGGDGVDGVASEQWLRSQLREHERGGGTVPGGPGAGGVDGVHGPEDEAPEDEQHEPRRDGGRETGVAAGGAAAGAAGWGGGSATSGSAPLSGNAAAGQQVAPGAPNTSGWGWNPSAGNAPGGGFTGAHAAGGQGVDGTSYTPGGAGTQSSGGTATTGVGGGFSAGVGRGPQGAQGVRDHYGPGGGRGATSSSFARGTDFNVTSDELARDAEQWRRLALEMEGVGGVTRTVRDGHSSFGLVSEPAAAYSRATHQCQLWSAQAAKAYEELAHQLNATAAGYEANEQAAVDRTGKVFDS